MEQLVKITDIRDIFPKYRNTPIDDLLQYHNLGSSDKKYDNAEILIGMCMDYRKRLRIPLNFAYVIRTGGGNLRQNEFLVSFAIAVGGVKTLALIGHNHCGMSNLESKRENFIKGLSERAGWDKKKAEEHFSNFLPMFEIGNEIEFLLSETKRLRKLYPKILIAPLFYNVDDQLLYLVNE